MTTPAGWYDDGTGGLRWWDGHAWTEHRYPPPAVTPPVSVPGPQYGAAASQYLAPGPVPRRRMPVWGWVLIALAVTAIVAVVVAIVVLAMRAVTESAAPAQSRDPAAAAAVESVVYEYDRAWKAGDCAAMQLITTESYRESEGWTSCEDFATATEGFLDDYPDYVVAIDEVSVYDGSALVMTTETYTGADGPTADIYAYDMVRVDGAWLVDWVQLTSE